MSALSVVALALAAMADVMSLAAVLVAQSARRHVRRRSSVEMHPPSRHSR